MGPMRKDILDKAAWAWVDCTDPTSVTREHVLKAYRTQLPECQPGTCRRNCRGSPRCLSGLGEQRWISGSSEESTSSYGDDPNIDRRDSGSFIGLKNLGATCYVNSLLQLWFHNLQFRKAIYEWDPMEDPDERQSILKDESKFPITHVGHLQVLFANLQFSVRRYIDPSDFVHSLGLDTNQQQDAQEFSKLFISMLEDRLATQTKPFVHDMISKNFKGEYFYVTKCSKCQRESTRPSTFYELDLNIQGHRTLGDSLAEFLHEEKLEGANKYHCAVCRDKQDAVRCIRLKSLPPVLHLQLLRFVYDRSKGHKKKLNSIIQFPETLDMSEYLGLAPDSKVYHVSAVLLHMGSSAYSGHYIAHIKDSVSGIWYKFNDESVEKMEGKKLSLGSEEDSAEVISIKTKGRNQRSTKGFVNSKNAYMLVYTLASGKDDIPAQLSISPVVPNHQSAPRSNGVERHGVTRNVLEAEMMVKGLAKRLREKVNEQNWKFEEWTTEESTKRETYKVQTQFHRNEMLELCSKLGVPPGVDKFDFLSSEWLSKCLHDGLGEDCKVPPINNSNEICPHGRVDPSRVTNMKIISTDAANMLYKRFSGGPRVQSPEALCVECVANKCMEIRLKNKITSDGKEITNLLKYRMDETDPGYWVGKNTLKSWKSIVLRSSKSSSFSGKEEVENLDGTYKSENEDDVGSSSTDFMPAERQQDSKVSTSEDEETDVSENIAFKTHNARKRGKFSSKHSSDKTPPQKRIHLYSSSQNGSNPDECAPLTSEDPLQDCKSRVPSPNEKEDKKEEDIVEEASHTLGFNEDAICEHGNLNIDESSRRLVPPRIWTIFTSYFPSAAEFPRNSPVCPMCQEKAFEGQVVKDTHRKVAQQQRECLGDLYLMRNRPNLDPAARKTRAINGTLCPVEGKEGFYIVAQEFTDRWKNFIGRRGEPPMGLLNESLLCPHLRLLLDPTNPEDAAHRMVLVWPPEWEALQTFYSVDYEISGSRDLLTGEVDLNPALCAECQESRREAQQVELCTYRRAKIFVRRVQDDTKAETTPPPDVADPEFQVTSAALTPTSGSSGSSGPSGNDAIRRSARSRKPRGDKELTMSSDQTLLDLKVEIYRHFQVAPYDQHLSLDGRSLEGAENTLGSLNVYPRSIVMLRADEPSEDAAIMDDYIKSSAPEEGFKGTGLLSR